MDASSIVTLIAAVAAAIVSIIAAFRGEQTKGQLNTLAASINPSYDLPPVIVPGPVPTPVSIPTPVARTVPDTLPPGGNSIAEIERWLAFFRSIFGGSPSSVDAAPGNSFGFGSVFAEVLRYYGLVTEVLSEIKSTGNLAVGATQLVPPIKFRAQGKSFTWDKDGITRTS